MQDYIKHTGTILSDYGFDEDNTMGMVAICRDEIAEILMEEVIKYWGEAFNCCSLGGFLTIGKTGLKAATEHTPFYEGRRRFVLYAMPHIAISDDGEIGEVYRHGIQKVSHACGALSAIVEELQSGHLQLMTDMQDIEQSIVRQKILSSLNYGDKPDLVKITKLAGEIISRDVEELLISLDSSIFNYAVVTGVQIHGPSDTHWIYPDEFYLVADSFPDGRKNLQKNYNPANHS